MGLTSDLSRCGKIKTVCGNAGIPCELQVTSAPKGPDETLRIQAEYEGNGIPTVFVAVAGRSTGGMQTPDFRTLIYLWLECKMEHAP